jgi:tetratricopeptide (TPR) repeat protein
VEQHSAALAMCRDLHDPALTALVLNNLGETHIGAGDQASAIDCFQRALELVGPGVDPIERTRSLVGLGDAHALAGHPKQARQYWTEARRANPAMCQSMASRVEQRLARIDG